MKHSIFQKFTPILKVLVLVILFGVVPIPSLKTAQATCGQNPSVNVSFNYIRNGVVQSYGASAGGFSPMNYSANLVVDKNAPLSNIRFSLQANDSTSEMFVPSTGWQGYGPDSDTHYGGPYASSPITVAGQYLYGDAANSCGGSSAVVYITLDPRDPDPTFACSVSEATATVDPGMSHTFSITTFGYYGFNSPITFSAPTYNPSTANPPTSGAYTNNGQIPPKTLTVTINTSRFTTPKAYQVYFWATGGGVTNLCVTQLVVNNVNPDFNLVISPSSITPNGLGVNTNPNRSNIGQTVLFDVFANCTGPFAGPVTNITVSTSFSNIPTPTLGTNQLYCGQTTTLTVIHTELIPAVQQSTALNTILQAITLQGYGQF